MEDVIYWTAYVDFMLNDLKVLIMFGWTEVAVLNKWRQFDVFEKQSLH